MKALAALLGFCMLIAVVLALPFAAVFFVKYSQWAMDSANRMMQSSRDTNYTIIAPEYPNFSYDEATKDWNATSYGIVIRGNTFIGGKVE